MNWSITRRHVSMTLLGLLAWCLQGGVALAHESLPASLMLVESARGTFDVDWRLPATQGTEPSITPQFPTDCTVVQTPYIVPAPSAVRLHWRLRCAGGLRQTSTIHFDGLPANMTSAVLVRIAYRDGTVFSRFASPSSPLVEIGTAAQEHYAVADYFGLGVMHILTGYDHLLFVLCLVLLADGIVPLLKTITAFTLAHSITLAAASLGLVHVSPAPVEASIALSIVFLARELIREGAAHGISVRWPWLVAFSFGLLHGLGFAGALSEVGLPADDIPLALLLFNLGVEAGQLAFVSLVLGGWWCFRKWRFRQPAWGRAAISYAVGTTSAFWMLQRLLVIAGT